MNDQTKDIPLIYLIAGEPSGDQLGARLMAALKRATNGRVRFAGVGGERMQAEGLVSLFPINEIAVMGLAEILPHIPVILRRIRETVADVEVKTPAALVTIDAPGFCSRVSKALKGKGIPLIHYVAPSVWAWKKKRAQKISAYLDHLLTLLPFEPPYFEKHGLAATFVGHPVIEAVGMVDNNSRDFLCQELGLAQDRPILAILPGSRRGEVARLGPIFKETVTRLAQSIPDLQCIIPTVSNVREAVSELAEDWPVPVRVIEGVEGKHKAFCCADSALAASGTVALELAVDGVPAVIAYKVAPLTAFLARFLISIKFVSLPNILVNKEIQPERIQKNCKAEILAEDLRKLLLDPEARKRQIDGYKVAVGLLKSGDDLPSDKAAETILATISNR
ncbi:lipid-A-disaccharide synthase [Kiloniella laminariae]|uniref:Lipid-A-disaccharide synthase n=1 Tax=Kiloniella laminariae TaxID=454162 RepID=A0ABT4LLU5_9PROT|nr:lipid-A-disaccharide synthase [Kiloniella laminariae]MCZ4282036.1 lipid-A-disaccharide synthase [Kiloniella laminariae]